jgi:hypothetical protein
MNIGRKGESLNACPFFFRMETFKEFSDMLRRDAFVLATWASDHWISKYHLYLYIHIEEDDDYEWDFHVKCENIREYKPYLKLQKEEMDQIKMENARERKINEIIDNI